MKRFLYRQHGRHSLELKIRYLIHSRHKQRKNYFNIRLYLFFPYSFNINPKSYPKEHFYEDQKLYLRFNTPVFSLQELISEEKSPFVRVRSMLTHVDGRSEELNIGDYVYETKLCGSVFKSVLRDSYYRARKRVKREQPEEWRDEISAMIDALVEVAGHFHDSACRVEEFSEKVRYHTILIDEYISLELEKYMLWLLDLMYTYRSGSAIVRQLEKVVSTEMEYRRRSGYASVSDSSENPDDYEEYAYRAKILKRYSSEVLFFNVRRKQQGKRVEHVLYAVAAGIAMFIATTIAFMGQTWFGNLSTSLFILLVVSYMLKDRIKDIFRDLFSRSIGSFFYNRGVKVYDPRTRRKMAYVKERVAFSDFARLPKEIQKIRSRSSFEKFLATTASETILVYEKNVQLNARAIKRLHSRIKGVADINIISLKRLLRYLTVQRREIPIVSSGRVQKLIPVKRIYHLNVIAWYQGDDAAFIDRIRLIVDGKGIKRIEKVDSLNAG
ncbi:MAG: hypothetical protein ACOCZA_08285 [Spirochaetota bacterium]